MFEGINKFFKKVFKVESKEVNSGKEAKERLHLVLMQDRANVSADFLDMMKQEIIEVIKKYIDVDENAIDVRLTNQTNDDGSNGAPALYANIPIINIKEKETMSNDLGGHDNIETNNSESDNEPLSENISIGDATKSNKSELENESTSNNVEVDNHIDQIKPESDKESMSENVEVELQDDLDKSESDGESISGDDVMIEDSTKIEKPKE